NFSGFTRTIRPARNSERGTRSCSSVPHSEFRVPRWEGVLVGEVSSPPLGKLGGVKLVELTVHHVRIPLRKAVRHASYTRSDPDTLVVRCVLDDGPAGFGEGVPREYVTGETVESGIELLRRSDLAAQFEPVRDFAQAVQLAERLQLAAVPGDERGCRG